MSKTPLTPLRSPPGQTDLVDSLVAPGQVDQVESTTCSHCGSSHLERFCHLPPDPIFHCRSCGTALNEDGSVCPDYGNTIHPEKTGWDKLDDRRFVLAKGAGPGIWNHWVSHVGGYRVFWSRVDGGYLA